MEADYVKFRQDMISLCRTKKGTGYFTWRIMEMPRIARGIIDGFIYHVLNRGNGRQVVFHKDRDYTAFIDLMREANDRHPVKILAYCLMPNHFHMVLSPIKTDEFSKWVQWLMTSHVRRYHRHYGTSGHIWQGRYKSFVIQGDNHLLTVLRYVEGNPVRAGLVGSVKEWPWSSYHERITGRSDLLVPPPIVMPENWGDYVDEPLTEKEKEKLRNSVNRQSPYGSLIWQQKVAAELGIESTVRPRGRPKKPAWQAES